VNRRRAPAESTSGCGHRRRASSRYGSQGGDGCGHPQRRGGGDRRPTRWGSEGPGGRAEDRCDGSQQPFGRAQQQSAHTDRDGVGSQHRRAHRVRVVGSQCECLVRDDLSSGEPGQQRETPRASRAETAGENADPEGRDEKERQRVGSRNLTATGPVSSDSEGRGECAHSSAAETTPAAGAHSFDAGRVSGRRGARGCRPRCRPARPRSHRERACDATAASARPHEPPW